MSDILQEVADAWEDHVECPPHSRREPGKHYYVCMDCWSAVEYVDYTRERRRHLYCQLGRKFSYQYDELRGLQQ